MIVLDEQLLGRNLENEISHWYQGEVCFITDLRPGSVIKDDAIPKLLQHANQPTFVTINERDFWRRTEPNQRYCLVCYTLTDSQAHQIAFALRDLLQHSLFDSKAKRMGKIIRVTNHEITYYATSHRKLQTVLL
ncbi:MAG: hypothetical protein KC423_18980 [Anaerolineales bacterium]|nr:hypothetical protein [Anaerolineales bacterium]